MFERNGQICVLGLGGVALAWSLMLTGPVGCQSAREYRKEADEVAEKIIEQGQRDALGRTEPFTIEQPSQTLRRRLMEVQNLTHAGPASLGVDQLEPIDHWPDDDLLTDRPAASDVVVEVEPGKPVGLSLVQALQVGAANSREYQSRKESVFQTALALDLQRDAFRNTFAGTLGAVFGQDLADASDEGNLATTAEGSVTRRFQNGLSLTSRIIFDLAALLTPNRDAALGIATDISVSLPLLSGSGEHYVREPLTQAERDVMYSLWQFERYKRTFAVGLASDYLSVVQRLDEVTNAENNYRRLIDASVRAQALAEEGDLPEIQVNQARSDELRARDRWVSAQAAYERSLDQFKQTLGLPTDAVVGLDSAELERLAETARQALEAAGIEAAPEYQRDEEAGTVTLLPPGEAGAGPYELPEAKAVRLALDNRLDLRVAVGEVYDVQRDIVRAADDLKPGLTLSAGYDAGERRGSGSADQPNGQLRPEEGSYSLGLEFEFPWDKVSDRNAYRNQIIALESAVRDVQALEDRIKSDLRDGLRTLVSAREGIRIQGQALIVAERRVESTRLFFELGRAEIRDVLEAQESLVEAQNALTNALVSYRVAELELQRDMGVLQVNEKGLWREYAAE